MVELRETGPARFELILQPVGGPAELYRGSVRACMNVHCNCREMTLELEPDSEEARRSWTGVSRFTIALDPFERRQYGEGDPREFPERDAFAAKLVAGLDDAGWQVLARQYVGIKRLELERFDPDTTVLELPFEEIERDGIMVSYREVFPFSEGIALELEEQHYYVDELHCVREECDCSTAMLVPAPIHEGRAEGGTPLPIDVVTGRWSEEGDAASSPELTRRLREALLQQNPKLIAVLRNHHDVLRRVYRSSKRRFYRPVLPIRFASPKVGRNEPCPCGSGRKSKKCCGGGSVHSTIHPGPRGPGLGPFE